jgi:hypothetical protein
MKKVFLVLALAALLGGTAFSFDLTTFPASIQKGDILISPAFNFGSYYGWASVIGITGSVEYALPTPIALAVGGEVGFATVLGDDYGGGYSYGLSAVPIFAKASWHPNFEVAKLDTYVSLKLGWALGFLSDAPEGMSNPGGFSYGTNVGARWFLTDTIAIFGELGYDHYNMSMDYKYDDGYGYSGTLHWTYYMYTWFHAGVTFKL